VYVVLAEMNEDCVDVSIKRGVTIPLIMTLDHMFIVMEKVPSIESVFVTLTLFGTLNKPYTSDVY